MSPENQDALRRADDIERGERSGMWYESSGATAHIRRLVAGIEAERQSRQAAQIENEALKARIARADVELQRAVLAEREACAKVLNENAKLCVKNKMLREILEANADAIRARGAA